jgi:cysteine desulfurase
VLIGESHAGPSHLSGQPGYHADRPACTQGDAALARWAIWQRVQYYARIRLEAARAVEGARDEVARLIGASRSSEIVFTSGATESNNAILKGIVGAPGRSQIVTTEIEHPSVLETWGALRDQGVEVAFVRPQSDGIVRSEDVSSAVRSDTRLVSGMFANNEVGSIQPIEEISRVTTSRGIPLHVDAAQALGKADVAVAALGIDVASMSAHKLYGPKGIGALYIRTNAFQHKLRPLLHGGGQETGVSLGHSACGTDRWVRSRSTDRGD